MFFLNYVIYSFSFEFYNYFFYIYVPNFVHYDYKNKII